MKIINLFFILFFLVSCSQKVDAPMSKVSQNINSEFNLPNLDNAYVSSDEYKGKYILINFWATWCAPCVKELPSLNNLNKIFLKNDSFEMIAINIGQEKSVVKKFLNEKASVDFTVLLDEKMELSNWNVQAIPTTFLVDKTGKVLYKSEGEKSWDDPKFITFFNSFLKK